MWLACARKIVGELESHCDLQLPEVFWGPKIRGLGFGFDYEVGLLYKRPSQLSLNHSCVTHYYFTSKNPTLPE